MLKSVDTRITKHFNVGLRAHNNLPQSQPYISVFQGCGRLLHLPFNDFTLVLIASGVKCTDTKLWLPFDTGSEKMLTGGTRLFFM